MRQDPDLGKKLSSARNASGLSIEDISRQTHIPENALRHLEKGQLSEFPSPEYAEGFLAQYSAYLGLSPIDQLHSPENTENLPQIATQERLQNHRIMRVEAADKRPPSITEPCNSGRGLLRSRGQKEKESKEAHSLPINKRQPLIVFSITSILIACSLFAYMELSGDFGQEEPASVKRPTDPLGAIGGLSAQTTGNPVFSNVPRALPVSQEAPHPLVANGSGEATTSQNLSASAASPSVSFEGFSLESPPPRAVIVEE